MTDLQDLAQRVEIGTGPDWSEIVKRRFGSDHAKPCAVPTIKTCAAAACQLANRCRHKVALSPKEPRHEG